MERIQYSFDSLIAAIVAIKNNGLYYVEVELYSGVSLANNIDRDDNRIFINSFCPPRCI